MELRLVLKIFLRAQTTFWRLSLSSPRHFGDISEENVFFGGGFQARLFRDQDFGDEDSEIPEAQGWF